MNLSVGWRLSYFEFALSALVGPVSPSGTAAEGRAQNQATSRMVVMPSWVEAGSVTGITYFPSRDRCLGTARHVSSNPCPFLGGTGDQDGMVAIATFRHRGWWNLLWRWGTAYGGGRRGWCRSPRGRRPGSGPGSPAGKDQTKGHHEQDRSFQIRPTHDLSPLDRPWMSPAAFCIPPPRPGSYSARPDRYSHSHQSIHTNPMRIRHSTQSRKHARSCICIPKDYNCSVS